MKNETLKAGALAALLTTTGCTSLNNVGDGVSGAWDMAAGPREGASRQEIECHKMASDGRFVNIMEDTVIGAGGGAAIGALSNGSVWKGAGWGAGAGAIWGSITEGSAFKRAFDECMHNSSEWRREYSEYENGKPLRYNDPEQCCPKQVYPNPGWDHGHFEK